VSNGVQSLSVQEKKQPNNTAALTDSGESEHVPIVDELHKRARTISKKLIQIERLKKKKADGQPLNVEEETKLKTEAALKQELNAVLNDKH